MTFYFGGGNNCTAAAVYNFAVQTMSGCDALRRRKNVVAKQPAAEADDADDVTMTPGNDDVKTTSRDISCLNVMHGLWTVLASRLHQPVDASSLAVFRLLFGMYVA